MGQEVDNSDAVTDELPDTKAPAYRKPLEHSYTREFLLSFADLASCKKRPESLDPVVWRDAPASDVAEGGIAIPAVTSRGLVRRDRDGEPFSKSPVDIPEWRKDSWRSGGSGTSLQQGPRRKPYDEETLGNSFSGSYPPRPAGAWVDNGYPRGMHERTGLQSQGSGRWEHRTGLGDREREHGRQFQKWDGEDIVPLVPPDAPRTDVPRFGSGVPVARPGWISAERDGLLGSGGVLHRTYTGNFTTPSSLRIGPERQMSLGPLDRQIGLGPLDRQSSMGPLDSQNSLGRIAAVRNNEPLHLPRPMKAPIFARREDTDFVNDETFGSEESSTDDRSEQERKRRESFEMMRKDHQRLLQKQQKLITQKHEERLANPESNANRKHDESTLWDSTLPAAEIQPLSPKSPPKSSMGPEESNLSAVPIAILAPSTPRPAIPPGFAKVVQQIQTISKGALLSETPLEACNLEGKDSLKFSKLQSEPELLMQGSIDDGSKADSKLVPMRQCSLDPHMADSVSKTPSEPHDSVSPFEPNDSSEPAIASGERAEMSGFSFDSDQEGISSNNVKENNFIGVGEYNKGHESLLDKWFGRSKSVQGSEKDGVLSSLPVANESQDMTKKEAWSGVDSKTSKFAQWFHPEESHPMETATVSAEVSSLFPKGGILESSSTFPKNQAVQDLPQTKNPMSISRSHHGRILPMPYGPSLEDIEKGLTASANKSDSHERNVEIESTFLGPLSLKNLTIESKSAALSGSFGEHSPVGKFNYQLASPKLSTSKSSPIFLTCEDIEQSMLAEAGTTGEKNIHRTTQPARGGSSTRKKDEQAAGQAADSAASRHLMSLLQKGTIEGMHAAQNNRSSLTEPQVIQAKSVIDGNHNGDDWGQSSAVLEVGGSSKRTASEAPTLETLFGKAFMKELRSSEAPVSAHNFSNEFYGNFDDTKTIHSLYPVSRQSSGRLSNLLPNTNFSKQWPGPIGPLSKVGWTEGNVLDANKSGNMDVTVPQSKTNKYATHDIEDDQPVSSSGSGSWGNGANVNLLASDGSVPISTTVATKGIFLSNMESTSYVPGDKDSSVNGKGHMSRVHNIELDTHTGSTVSLDGKSRLSSNFTSGQLKISEDGNHFTSARGKGLSNDEPLLGPSSSFDTPGLLQVFKEDGLPNTSAADSSTAMLESSNVTCVSLEEKSSAASQGIDSYLLASQTLDRMEIQEDTVAGDKIVKGDDTNAGHDRTLAVTLSNTSGYIDKMKDGVARVQTVSSAGLPEKSNTGFARSSSTSARFKSNMGGIQPPAGFLAFQPATALPQHQQSSGSVYRSEPSLSLQSRQSSIPVHHPLHPNPSSVTLSMFPQQFHPQPGLPPQQHLLARAYSNGSSLEYPHAHYGHVPANMPNRPLPGAQLHFSPTAHGHLSPPGAYHPMGHMGPANQFLAPPQLSHRGPVMSPLAEAHMYMQEQALHDLHGLVAKPVPQQSPALFPIGGNALQSGQGPIFHQPLPHNLRGHSGPGPWGLPYSSDLMRTGSKGHELAGFTNGNGVAVGPGVNSLDRWFAMELAQNVPGLPTPGLIQVSPPVLDLESKLRYG